VPKFVNPQPTMGQTQSAEILTLDANIRDWVVLPMLLIMIFVNLVRECGSVIDFSPQSSFAFFPI
jgi:hypothetical protein